MSFMLHVCPVVSTYFTATLFYSSSSYTSQYMYRYRYCTSFPNLDLNAYILVQLVVTITLTERTSSPRLSSPIKSTPTERTSSPRASSPIQSINEIADKGLASILL